MSNVNKGIKIFAWITGGLILILACLFIPVMKSYLYDPVITEQTVCYVYPKWNDVQLDSALHSVIPDENSIPRVKRLLSFYKFDSNVRVGAYRLHAGMTARQMALKLSRGSQSPIRVTFNNVRTLEQLAERVSGQLFFSKEELLALLYNDSVCADLGFTKATLPALFLPDTYEFYWTVTPESFLQKMKREYRIYWEGKREQQAKRWGWELDGPFEFYDAVKDGGKWDYKLHPDGSEWIPRNGVFSVNGKKMTAEQLGNINYGFTGSVLGFPAPVLRMAGGFVAIKNSGINWEDWWYDFDSKEDAEMIQLGIDMEYLMTITGYSTDEVVDFFWK